MERKIRALFDFQKFEGNADLQQVIDSVHAKYGMEDRKSSVRELSLDEMAWLAAAGTPDPRKEEK